MTLQRWTTLPGWCHRQVRSPGPPCSRPWSRTGTAPDRLCPTTAARWSYHQFPAPCCKNQLLQQNRRKDVKIPVSYARSHYYYVKSMHQCYYSGKHWSVELYGCCWEHFQVAVYKHVLSSNLQRLTQHLVAFARHLFYKKVHLSQMDSYTIQCLGSLMHVYISLSVINRWYWNLYYTDCRGVSLREGVCTESH
jgi:hypothetical protein